MKTIHIGDIHNNVRLAESICKKHSDADKIVFHGDYLDSFGDNIELTQHTCNWLEWSLKQPNRVHLWGNHDLHYWYGHPGIQCSGYTKIKQSVIKNHPVFDIARDKLFLCANIQGFLCSHAGLHPNFIPPQGYSEEWLMESIGRAFINLTMGNTHHLVGVGYARMGDQRFGGMTWLDWNEEFEPIEGLNQIVGHTHNEVIRKKNNNYCIDSLPNQYLMVEDGIGKILEI